MSTTEPEPAAEPAAEEQPEAEETLYDPGSGEQISQPEEETGEAEAAPEESADE